MRTRRGNQAYALQLLGAIATHRTSPDADAATAHYCQALALAEALGQRPLQAHCHRGLGTLLERRVSGSRPAPRCRQRSRCIVTWSDLLAPGDRGGTGQVDA